MQNKETKIQDQAIVACTDIACLWRYQVGKFYTLDARLITIGIVGFPDVFGFRKSDGKFIVLEFKTKEGTLREEQINFKNNIGTKYPIIYGIPRSIEDARRIILNK